MRTITTYDVRWGCDVLRPVYDAAGGVDGRVSIEVDPRLAHDTERDRRRGPAAVVAGRPAQPVHQDPGDRGRPAGDHRSASPTGISVNVTLIFSLERYSEVMDAFLAGLEQAQGRRPRPDAASRRSRRSSSRRVDTEIDKRLDKLGTDEAKALRGQGRDRQRPAGLPSATSRSSRHRPLAGAGRGGRPAAAPAVGLDRRQGPGVRRHPVRRRAGRPGRRSTRCPRRRWTRSPTTA